MFKTHLSLNYLAYFLSHCLPPSPMCSSHTVAPLLKIKTQKHLFYVIPFTLIALLDLALPLKALLMVKDPLKSLLFLQSLAQFFQNHFYTTVVSVGAPPMNLYFTHPG